MSDTREKLIKLICDGTLKTEICTTDTHLECETCKGDCGYCTILADHLYLTYNKKKKYEFHFFQIGKRMWPAIWEEDAVTHWMPLPEPPKGE